MFDVAILGTGPGGGMAACALATSGLRVLLLEKHRLPRRKPCGGGLTASALALFDWDISPLVEREVWHIRSFYDHGSPHQTGRLGTPILMVDRMKFDHHLVERALALGKGDVELRDGAAITAVSEEHDGVSLRTVGGENLRARFLIAADGALSVARPALGLARVPFGVGIDAEVEVNSACFEREAERATFNYFCLPYGYGWIFPKGDVLSCGVGAFQGRPHLGRALTDFLGRSFPAGSIRRVRRAGYPIPRYQGQGPIASRRICLVGDAAGLVDPVMGEGIRYALHSGALAAEVIGELLGTGTATPSSLIPDCRRYQERIHLAMGQKLLAIHKIAEPIFLDAPRHFYREFVEQGQSYGQFSQRLMRQMANRKASSPA